MKNIILSLLAPLIFGFMIVCLMYAMVAEMKIREHKYSEGWYHWQHERALAEHHPGASSQGIRAIKDNEGLEVFQDISYAEAIKTVGNQILKGG